jgi:hypothetical protein
MDRVKVRLPLQGPAFVALVAMAILQSCCGPNACPQAKSGSAVLDKAVAAIEEYKERNRRYPVTLDDVEKGFQLKLELELAKACPDCTRFGYKTDSFGYEIEYQYPHMGKNRCVHNNEAESWSCKGIY